MRDGNIIVWNLMNDKKVESNNLELEINLIDYKMWLHILSGIIIIAILRLLTNFQYHPLDIVFNTILFYFITTKQNSIKLLLLRENKIITTNLTMIFDLSSDYVTHMEIRINKHTVKLKQLEDCQSDYLWFKKLERSIMEFESSKSYELQIGDQSYNFEFPRDSFGNKMGFVPSRIVVKILPLNHER